MMNKLSIKKKLLIYNLLIQFVILIFFSFSLYKALDTLTIDRLQATLKIIILDVVDDTIRSKHKLSTIDFREEEEYKFEPLYIRLLKLGDNIEVIKSLQFPSDILSDVDKLKLLRKDTIVFENQDSYIISRIALNIDSNEYVIEVATNNIVLNDTLENLLYILFFIVPIILILSTIGGYFLIYKSFLPIENILTNLKDINATDLTKRLVTLNNNDEIDLLAKEINSLIGRLEVSFDKISQFSSDASHELKTPLTIIRGELEIGLRKDRSVEDYKYILKDCLDEVLIIQQTIDDLLFLAKFQQQLKPAQKEDIYIDEISYEAIKELETYAKLKFVTIESNIYELIQIRGFSKLLKIAIKNLLKNAISFSHKNSSVILQNHVENNNIVISIKDKGIGITKEEQEKIFENFYRTDKSRNKNSGGTGLGMAICEKIIKIHNGHIKLISEENQGTIVMIYLPM